MIKCLKCQNTYEGNVLLSKCPHCDNSDLSLFIRVDGEIDPTKNKQDREWLESRIEEENSNNCYHKWIFFAGYCQFCGQFGDHGERISICIKCGIIYGCEYGYASQAEIDNLLDPEISNLKEFLDEFIIKSQLNIKLKGK